MTGASARFSRTETRSSSAASGSEKCAGASSPRKPASNEGRCPEFRPSGVQMVTKEAFVMAEHEGTGPELDDGDDVEAHLFKEALAAGAVSAALFAGQAGAQNVDPGGGAGGAAPTHWVDPGGGAGGAVNADPGGGAGGAVVIDPGGGAGGGVVIDPGGGTGGAVNADPGGGAGGAVNADPGGGAGGAVVIDPGGGTTGAVAQKHSKKAALAKKAAQAKKALTH